MYLVMVYGYALIYSSLPRMAIRSLLQLFPRSNSIHDMMLYRNTTTADWFFDLPLTPIILKSMYCSCVLDCKGIVSLLFNIDRVHYGEHIYLYSTELYNPAFNLLITDYISISISSREWVVVVIYRVEK